LKHPMIAKRLRDESLSLEDAIHSDWLPAGILHLFACDCAERALRFDYGESWVPDIRCWDALRTKRQWVEGKSTIADLKRCIAHVETVEEGTEWPGVPAVWAVLKAMECDPKVAANRSAVWGRYSAEEQLRLNVLDSTFSDSAAVWNADVLTKEMYWQCCRLAGHIERYVEKRRHLLALLLWKARQGPALDWWEQELELSLFEYG